MTVFTPTFSIVVAVLNGSRTLGSTIESVVAQRRRDHELIVMDGGSTDGTQRLLEASGSAVTLWESAPDRGICHAWNKAVAHATGEWLLFLGADDTLADPDVLATAAGRLAGMYATVAYGRVAIEQGTGPDAVVGEPWEIAGRSFLYRNTLPHQGVFHRRDLFARNGKFDEGFRICGDYEFLLRELRHRPPAFIDGLVVTRMGGGGISNMASSGLRATREFHRARRLNGLARAPEWAAPRVWRAAVYEGLRRTFGPRVARSVADAYQAVTRGFRSSWR